MVSVIAIGSRFRNCVLSRIKGKTMLSKFLGNLYFFKNVDKKRSYGLNISRNIRIKYLFYFKLNFYVLDLLHVSCVSAFKGYIGAK